MKIKRYEFKFTPLKVIAVCVFGLLFLFSLLANCIATTGFARIDASIVFSMFGEWVIAFVIFLAIWITSDVLERKKIYATEKPKTSTDKEIVQ